MTRMRYSKTQVGPIYGPKIEEVLCVWKTVLNSSRVSDNIAYETCRQAILNILEVKD